jgi:hypothetical protein
MFGERQRPLERGADGSKPLNESLPLHQVDIAER